MSLKKILILATALAAIAAVPAQAGQVAFNFATSTPLIGGSVTGSGFFTTSDTAVLMGGRNTFDILSITGTVNGSAIVAPLSNYGDYYSTGPFLDGVGLRFFTAAGNDIRFFYQDTAAQFRVNTFSPGSSSFVTASATPLAAAAVPEPISLSLFGAGVFGAAALRRRKKRLAA